MRFILLLVLFYGCCVAQVGAQTTRRAKKLYKKAVKEWVGYQKTAAYRKMSRSIRKSPLSPAGYGTLAEWYYSQNRFNEAAHTLEEAMNNCDSGRRTFAKPLARCLLRLNEPGRVISLANEMHQSKDTEWNAITQQALWLQSLYLRSYVYDGKLKRMSSAINSKYVDIYPAMSTDTTILLFTRRLKNMNEEFFIASYTDTCKAWEEAQNMGAPPNTPDNDAAQFISADGHYLFFARSDIRSYNGWNGGGYDLFMAYRVALDSPWTIPEPFGGTINTPYTETTPCLSADNRFLFFASNRPGGYGGMDIWISQYVEGYWQLPKNAGSAINTAGNETSPYLALDNKTLFFTSDGHLGYGGTDIYKATQTSDTTFSNVTNLYAPINTPYNEASCCLKPNGKELIFASDRQGPAGNYDLYTATLPFNMQPAPISFYKGYVYDSLTKERLNFASIYITNAGNGDTIYHAHSNRGDGSFLFPLNNKLKYAVACARVGYTEIADTFAFDAEKTNQTLSRPIAMLPRDYLAPINDSLVATVHFDINKVELTPADKAAIAEGIAPFINDQTIMVFVNGYTDNTGNPLINESLSTRRAALVAKEVVNLGMEELQVVSKGWGEAKMIADNDTEDNRRKNRRVEIMIKR
ncbi:MAG: hypothetical protein EBX41_04310 [Chitinophagia bacterium]|nr:hypothetical protein [Chitinophagia bacterium]